MSAAKFPSAQRPEAAPALQADVSPSSHVELPAASRNDSDELAAFESGTLDPAKFNHRLHLSLAWTYLQRHGFPDGALRFRQHLRAYVEQVGAASKYHETLTWAYLVLLNEELSLRSSPQEPFDSMIVRRPDLLDHRNGAITRCYSKSRLDLPEARRVFLLPMWQEGTAP